ncbi:hypothetical protein [Alicyclobacillus ferrooxydans]|uniref:UmuC domain-containing protein n=1 Tax=Alicyclobacillus ferrooxydans TaxID=471514 RepID=A0A0N8PP86_9BACL|nr:hypothetical protein [Alicyclobacillus ferrooxydans]KPV43629.1 hypothetical protein AN477_11550 [Alicyclobacillus ferrooxydans]
MRFTLFAQAQGVRSDSTESLWATESSSGHVTDASLSARKRGVRPGMQIGTAKALVPELTSIEEAEGLPSSLEKTLRVVLSFTPWIEIEEKDAFFFQIPGERPPLREVRRILEQVNEQFTEEQSIQVGLAETPRLAKALVEWNKVERVQGALYWRVGSQLWLISPSLAGVISGSNRSKSNNFGTKNSGSKSSGATSDSAAAWMSEMPITAFWDAPVKVRERLLSLGVYRIGEISRVPTSYLKRQFGEEALLWTQLQRHSSERLRVNYPLPELVRTWCAEIGNEVPSELLIEIVRDLSVGLADELSRKELGALKIGVAWRTNDGEEHFERATKQPLCQVNQLIAAVESGCLETSSKSSGQLVSVRLYAKDIQPLSSIQLALSQQSPEERRGTVDILRVVRHVNRKFPDAVQMGIRPTFRELRLQAVLEARAGSVYTSRWR